MNNRKQRARISMALPKVDSASVRTFCHRLILILTTVSISSTSSLGSPLCSQIVGNKKPRILPSKHMEKASLESKKLWESFEKIYQARVQFYLNKSKNRYQEAQAKKHPHIRFLENLGFELPTIKVPPFYEVLDRIELQIWKKIDLGEIRYEDAIWPVMTLRLRNNEPAKLVIDGDVHRMVRAQFTNTVVSYGDEPITSAPWRLKVKEKKSFQSYRDFARLLANNQFPIAMVESANGRVRGDGISALQHDLAHLDVLLEYPQFAFAMKTHHSRALSEEKTAADDIKFQVREFLAFESSFVVGPKSVKQLETMLRLPDGLLSRGDDKSALKNYFGSLSRDQLIELARYLQTNEYQLLVPIGAAIRDVISQFEFSSFYQFPSKSFYQSLEAVFNRQVPSSKLEMVEALTKSVVFMKTFQPLSPEDWIEAIIVDDGQKSKLKAVVDEYDRHYPNAPETKIIRDYFQ